MALEERVLAAYYDRLTAFAIDKSRVITIEFQSADPELAARVANLIAEKYLSFQQVAKQDQARSAGQWLSGELEKLRSKVSEAEAKVEDYRAKSNLFVGSNNTSLVNQQLTELSSQVSAARAQKADAEARARLDPRGAALRPVARFLRRRQFRADPPAVRAARDACGRSSPSNPRRCCRSIRASRKCGRRSPISTSRSAPKATAWCARWKAKPRSRARGLKR